MSKTQNPSDWMTEADKDVLKTLEETGLILTPTVIAINRNYTRQTASRALKRLVAAGDVEKVSKGHYRAVVL